MTDRKWWPHELLDESMPPGRAHPSDWIAGPAGDGFALYGWDAEGDTPLTVVSEGTVVGFAWMEERGEVEVQINADGSYEVIEGTVPADVNHVWIPWDTDTINDSLKALAAQQAEWAAEVKQPMPMRTTVGMCRWSDEEKFRLAVTDGKAAFAPADETIQ